MTFKAPLTTSGKPCKRCASIGKPCYAHGAGKKPPSAVAIKRAEYDDVPGKCNGLKRDHTGLCGQKAGWGTAHPGHGKCKVHGGSSPAGKANGLRLMAELACAKFGVPVPVDPFTALTMMVHQCAGNVEFYRARVQAMAPDALVFGVASQKSYQGAKGAKVTEVTHAAGVAVWLRQYHEAQDRLVRVAATAIQCGLAAEQVRVAEEEGHEIARLIHAVLVELGVDKRDDVLALVRRKLLEVDERIIEAEVVNG